MKYISVAEMRNIDIQTDAVGGVSFAQLMENAGRGIAEIILDLPESFGENSILALVGPGNNGGDALVALNNLAAGGWDVTAYLFKRKADGDPLVERVVKAGGQIVLAKDDKDFEQLTDPVLQPLSDGGAEGYVIPFDEMLSAYYTARGWDENGIPAQEKLTELGLNTL